MRAEDINYDFHTLTKESALEKLQTDGKGLKSEEVIARREVFGYNELQQEKKETLLGLFVDQFKDILIIILIIAAGITALLNEPQEAILIVVILILNAILGVYQEWKADKAIEALKKMVTHKCIVLRDNETVEVDSHDLVPGDVVLLEQGLRVPADGRLIEVNNLRTEEAQLTGESLEVQKSSFATVEKDAPLGNRVNLVFMGTHVTFGKGKMLVTSTGMNTEMGKIARDVQSIGKDVTPTQVKLEAFGNRLGMAIIALMIFMAVYGILIARIEPLSMFEIAVSLAVAAIPEGLPIVVTLALALGVQRMSKENAIVKKLPAVESLGSVTIVCTDKTGTLTKNEMTVQEVILLEEKTPISMSVEELKERVHNGKSTKSLRFLVDALTLCNNAKMENGETFGDPTELALLRLTDQVNLDREKMNSEFKRIDEIPFDSERKRMTVVVQNNTDQSRIAFTKGAPEVLLNMAKYIDLGDGPQPLTQDHINQVQNQINTLTTKALRVLGFGYYELVQSSYNIYEFEEKLTINGFVGMIDPPKEGVKEAVQKCHRAGIRVVMVTGDHKNTATAIGKQIGIVTEESKVMTGQEIDKLSDSEFDEIIEEVEAFARINPQHKLKIVNAFKANDEIVAMTGDGINDAPALKGADIGIAMGSGTDVTKETADMILEDDNFTTIVKAIEEGRGIYDNMTKFIRYMLSSNLAEIVVIFLAIVLTLPTPFSATQILWINLVTDGVPALALGLDPASKGIMDRKPRDPKENLIARDRINHILLFGSYISLVTLGSYIVFYETNLFGTYMNYAVASTIAFAIMSMTQFAHSLNVREDTASILGHRFFKNKVLLITVFISIILQVLVIEGDYLLGLVGSNSSIFNGLFGTVHLTLNQWLYVSLISASLVVYAEILKWIKRHSHFHSIC